jgi:alpha-L-fucosidase
VFDPLKFKVLAYYYNRAQEWGEQVTVTGKGTAFIAGDLQDFETTGRMPRQMTDFTWLDHDNLAETWGYTEGSRAKSARAIVNTLVECVCRNGVYVVNVSPKGDGSIPNDQIASLRGIGQWLAVNGEAIYGSRVWIKSGEGDIRFTTNDGNLYAIFMKWPEGSAGVVKSLPADGPAGNPTAAALLGSDGAVTFEQTAEGLKLSLPAEAPGEGPYVVRIEGLKL